MDDSKRPYNWWPIITGVYEFNTSLNVSIVFLFFIIEWPFFVLTGEIEAYPLIGQIAAIVVHIVPTLVCLLEWRYNSIPFGWHRLPIYMLIDLIFILLIARAGEQGWKLY